MCGVVVVVGGKSQKSQGPWNQSSSSSSTGAQAQSVTVFSQIRRLAPRTSHLTKRTGATFFVNRPFHVTIDMKQLIMQRPRSLVLLGAVSSLAAVAAGSLPRGVGPECKLIPPRPSRVDCRIPRQPESFFPGLQVRFDPVANTDCRRCLPLPGDD